MDLSAIIFVVLAVAWAGYLIPKALRHHDELAGDRLDEAPSGLARVLNRHAAVPTPDVAAGTAPAPAADTTSSSTEGAAPVAPRPLVTRPLVTRAAARRAARNRRRVLYVLAAITAITAGVAGFGYTPWWSVAIPAGLIVLFLLVARTAVRRQAAGRRTVAPAVPAAAETVVAQPDAENSDDAEDTVGVSREALAAIAEEPLADDGSLWDPLPMTLPTYVGKARARRTVRTIELTGITSSGHDAADSTLAREAKEAEAVQAEADQAAEQRRVAGA